MKYAIAFGADKESWNNFSYRFGLIVVEARSLEQAEFMGLKEAKRQFPPAKGWANHDAIAEPIS
ncbi:MAG: hypothetical protein F6K16_24610 [Symploca sp. SIO2B6]|nr:hypothetical protein [Symploca sp. SIO2B6]